MLMAVLGALFVVTPVQIQSSDPYLRQMIYLIPPTGPSAARIEALAMELRAAPRFVLDDDTEFAGYGLVGFPERNSGEWTVAVVRFNLLVMWAFSDLRIKVPRGSDLEHQGRRLVISSLTVPDYSRTLRWAADELVASGIPEADIPIEDHLLPSPPPPLKAPQSIMEAAYHLEVRGRRYNEGPYDAEETRRRVSKLIALTPK